MKGNIYIARRVFSVLVLLMAFAVSVLAENRVYMEDFSINPGEQKTIAVYMDNEDAISSLQFDVVMPAGLSFVGEPVKNLSRITRSSHSLTKSANNGTTQRFVILENATDPAKSAIKLNEGALFTIDVAAAKTFKSGRITIRSIVGSDNTAAESKEIVMADYSATVSAYVGKFSVDVESVELELEQTQKVNVLLSNDVDINGLSAEVMIPAGLELVEDEEGELFGYTDRLSMNTTIVSNPIEGGYKILISSITLENFEGSTGAVFSFIVKATGETAEDAQIEVKNVTLSNETSTSYTLEGSAVVPVKVVTEPETIEGDLTGDGEVSVADIQAVINAWKDGSGDVKYDVNGDGEINVADIQYLINLMKK